MRLFFTLAVGLLLAAPAHGDEDRDLRARQLYEVGRKAYNDGNFQSAYDSFRDAYSLSHKAALLYNVASALQQLKRPHDAAETLRSYLRLRPDDSERGEIDERIKALDEEQRLQDIDRLKNQPPPIAPTPAETRILMLPTPGDELSARDERAARRRRRNIAIGVTVGSIVVVGAALGLGLGLGLDGGTQALTRSTVGPVTSTR